MRKKTEKKVFAAMTFVIAVSSLLQAIETGEIRGRIFDDKGASLPGVEVRAASAALQGTRTVFSSKNGEFTFPLLPVGTYTLTFLQEGFSTLVEENVVVRLGQVTSLSITMKFTEIMEEITVTAETLLIDRTASDTSFHLTTADLERLPVQNRTIVDAIKFTPGVTGVRVNTRRGTATEGQPSFRGEGEEGNSWIVDGLAVSGVRLKNSGLKINFDSIEEIQVISDPFSPEFASAYGGIINMVTKSGSNAFSGDMAVLFTSRNLQAARENQLSTASEPEFFLDTTTYFNLGGPVVKDRLWFFISNNYYRNTLETEEGALDYFRIPAGELTTHNNNFFAKLTCSPGSGQTISLTTIFDKSLPQKGGIGVPELYDEKSFASLAFRLNYKAILNSSTFLEAGLGRAKRDSSEKPKDGDLGPAQYFIQDLGLNIRNSYGNVVDNQKRLDFSLKLTKHQETDTFGRHEMSLGFEYYDFSSEFSVDFSGKAEDLFPGNGFDTGTKYYFETWQSGRKTPTFFYEYGPFSFINSAAGVGLFFKDKVTWGRVTLMAGLRSQTQRCLDDRGQVLWAWGLDDFISPRLTLIYDITGNGVNVLKLGWGRFSDLITTMPLGFFNSGAGLTFRTYRWQGGTNPAESEVHDPSSWKFEAEQKTQPLEVSEDIKPNFLTRYLVEFSRRLSSNWALKARFIHTRADKLLEILAIFDPASLYKFLYDNFEHKRRRYTGFEVEVIGRIGQTVFVNGSYAHCSAMGTNPGQVETGSYAQEEGSTNYLGLFGNHLYVPDIPELKDIKAWVDKVLGGLGGRGIGDEGWYGKLPYSVDHNIKLNAASLLPYGILFSSAFEYVSGYYWEKLGYVPFFGGYYAFPEGRGARKSPGHYYLDVAIEKSFQLGGFPSRKPLTLSLRAEVFNIFNGQKPISFVKEDTPLFGQVWGRQQPRQARVMAKLSW
ncbi:MAG: carboxypeptidase regulatory-like domain-containing protein [Clostridiales bacterium]|nr:carboxypeptidase regulatory-like domain-containing protein [Clostridiales bacterium]